MTKPLNKRQWESVYDLVNTSVDDAQSSLGCNRYSYDVLHKALEISRRRGAKTKVKIFTSAILKLQKKIDHS